MTSSLCRACSEIPFDPDLRTLSCPDYKGPNTWHLGSFGQVRARNCPFCQLVAPMCFKFRRSWDPFEQPEDSEEVTVGLDKFGLHVSKPILSWARFCIAALDDFIDVDKVRHLISSCDQDSHEDECYSTPFNPAILPVTGKRQIDFRVIDVDTMSIIYAPQRCRYIALSYVWGAQKKSRLVLTSHNEEDLMQPGAIEKSRKSIPNTIMDAITVVRKLHERYLWVDSLCLAQDDAVELQECVRVMDMFYEMAILTIVAADGEDAWTGLQGVAPTPRRINRQIKQIVPGLDMTTTGDLEVLLRASTYSTRAWTMQEEVISCRHLVFIDSRVYYRCACSQYNETSWQSPGRVQKSPRGVGSLQHHLLKTSPPSFLDFSMIIRYYMSRRVSFESDILRAAQGMLRKFSLMSGLHCFEGLPPPFGRSLLFQMDSITVFGRREGFPSYSWTGWKSVPWYNPDLEQKDGVSNDRSVEDNLAGSNADLRSWIIWHCKLEDGNLSRISDTGRLRKRLLLTPADSQHQARRRFRYIPISVSDIDFGLVRASAYPLLLFWTICVNLRLERMPQAPHDPVGVVNYRAINMYDEFCGEVIMDEANPVMTEGKFALLAAHKDSFWAMMLMWKDGIAERRGVVKLSGHVINSCLPPGPRWKAVVLG